MKSSLQRVLRGFHSHIRWLGTFLALIVATFVCVPAGHTQDRNWVNVLLPRGVSVDVPRNWKAISNNNRITLDTSVHARLDLSNLPGSNASELPFAANLYDDSGKVISLMNVRYYPEMEITQAEVQQAGRDDIDQLDKALHATMDKAGAASGFRIVQWHGTTKRPMNGKSYFETEYTRSGLNLPGNTRVRLLRLLDGPGSFTLTVSYYEPQAYLLRPISERMITSLRVSGR
jgi:hypothetical protein